VDLVAAAELDGHVFGFRGFRRYRIPVSALARRHISSQRLPSNASRVMVPAVTRGVYSAIFFPYPAPSDFRTAQSSPLKVTTS